MKKQYILLTALLVSGLTIAWQKSGTVKIQKNKFSHLNVTGAPTGRTGAPGELTCATSGCHGGTAQSGATENQFVFLNSGGTPVTAYIPGQTYTVGLSLASNPTKKGFQATVLTSANVAVGTLTGSGVGGTTVVTGGARKYVNHTFASSTSPAWGWTWQAPATDAGPVTFYIATNKSNNNGSDNGDVIYTSTHVIGSTASLDETTLAKVKDFNASFSAENSVVYISYNSLINGTSHVNIVDMSGRSVLNMELDATTIGLNKEMIRIPDHIKNGMYVVHYFVDNVASSKSISIQK